ncbi:MAG: YfhO family protein [Bacteroidales bacterium]|nr:YfhO family protein [Bacteroidales bacterium]
MNKIPFGKIAPYIAALAVFLLITVFYFSPLLEGKSLRQGDITHFKGMAKEIQDYREETGNEALWTGSMFSGMPAFQISVVYHANLMRWVDKVFRLGLPRPADYVFLYFAGFFILLLVLGLNPWLAAAGAFAFGLSSYFFIILEAGHNSKAHAIAYMAPVVAGIILTYRGKLLLGGIITALFLSLQMFANHLQITYYLAIIIAFIAAAQCADAIKEKALPYFFKASGILVLSAFLAILPNITNLWSTWEYGKETIRGKSELTIDKHIETSGLDKEYATQWSYGVGESWSLLIPNAKGGGTAALGNSPDALKDVNPNLREIVSQQNHYWGDQPGTSGPVYAGAIIMFLFIAAMFYVKSSLKWALFGATILSIMLAWGKNFMPLTDFFMDFIPGYNKFRAVSMTLVIAEFCIPFLAFLGLKEIMQNPPSAKKMIGFYVALGLTAGVSFLFYITPTTFFNFITASEVQWLADLQTKGNDVAQLNAFKEGLSTARISIFKMDAIRSFLYIAIASTLLWSFLRFGFNKYFVVGGLAILIVADMYTVNRRYVNEDSFERSSLVKNPFKPSNADILIMKDIDPNYRVFNTTVSTFNDASTSYFHKSIGGYHGAKLERYQELIEYQITKNNMQVLNMLNTKYFILKGPEKQPAAQVNMQALGNAWFVESYKLVDNADQEMQAMDSFKPAEVAIIDKRFAENLNGFEPVIDSSAQIALVKYQPNELVYQSITTHPQLAVFSEIFYDKGWEAFIDGKPVPHFRANYVLRAMVIPEGTHKIEFKFRPNSYYTGEKISLAGSLLLLFLLVGIVLSEVRKNLKNS